jgi:hypothetical protein
MAVDIGPISTTTKAFSSGKGATGDIGDYALICGKPADIPATLLLAGRVLVCNPGSKQNPRGEEAPIPAPPVSAAIGTFQLTIRMNAPLFTRNILTATLASLLIPTSASAHPGHYGHGADQSCATNPLQSLQGLDPLPLAVVITCLALFFVRHTYRKLP